MGESSEKIQTENWVGKTLLNKADIEEAWKEFDGVRGERLFCKDKDKRILEITGGVDSPLLQLVVFTEWRDFGKNTEDAIENNKMPIPEFIAMEPKIVDVEEEMHSRE